MFWILEFERRVQEIGDARICTLIILLPSFE